MTGQVTFDSHVLTLVEVAARLVNHLTPGSSGGHEVGAASGHARLDATATALSGNGRERPSVTRADAAALAAHAATMRGVFESAHRGDVAAAAAVLNELLVHTGARPQLDTLPGGAWHVHFHGTDDGLATGWAAGCATGLALAIGSNLAGRLGVCLADRCDRVYVDTSKNASRRFCSTACQNRVKAAAHRARR
ncbi:MAG TPA: CGNR zinc finger domain-containing protein [Nocardioidaceae bacterium]|nr:CGNR zinc finger domain-containing protein [Nocardioidaceae bacterium]